MTLDELLLQKSTNHVHPEPKPDEAEAASNTWVPDAAPAAEATAARPPKAPAHPKPAAAAAAAPTAAPK